LFEIECCGEDDLVGNPQEGSTVFLLRGLPTITTMNSVYD